MKLILFWILASLLSCLTLAYIPTDLPIIRPGEYQRFQINPFEQKLFQIKKSELEKNMKYEVRVSFLGNVINFFGMIYLLNIGGC